MKSYLRQKYRAIRDALSVEERLNQETYLNEALYDYIKNKDNIGIYLPIQSEVNIYPTINRLLEHHKHIYAPACLNDFDMEMRRYDNKALKEGLYHTVEPQSLETCNDLEIIIVPALAINTQGYRLGYGKGYYDQFLKAHKTETIAVIFKQQLVEEEFQDYYDIPIDKVIYKK